MLFAQQVDDVAKKAEQALNNPEYLYYAAYAVGAMVFLYVLVKLLGGKKEAPDLQKGLKEKLAEYPAPPAPGPRTLEFNGLQVRIRLIVLAPQGKQKKVPTADEVPNLLGDFIRGLQNVVKNDKPRIRIWPMQLSVDGFAPSFHRLVVSPNKDGEKSKWVRIAGPVKIGGVSYLLGMALWSEEATKIGKVIMSPTSWGSDLRLSE